MEKKQIITFGGYVGAGKSTAGKGVAQKLGYDHYSGGDFMRQAAKDKGLDFIEFNKILETTSEESKAFNLQIDSVASNVSKNKNKAVVDAHIGFHFAPNSFKVYLTISPEVAAARIASQNRDDEEFTGDQDAIDKVIWRAKSIQDRFVKLYEVNIRDLSNYDLVIDTGLLENNVDSVIAQVITAYNQWLES